MYPLCQTATMKKVLLYRASIVVCGSALGLRGLFSILTGSLGLVSILLSIGGFGMVGSTVYGTVLSSDSSAAIPDNRIV